jgi:hypothetical protein
VLLVIDAPLIIDVLWVVDLLLVGIVWGRFLHTASDRRSSSERTCKDRRPGQLASKRFSLGWR